MIRRIRLRPGERERFLEIYVDLDGQLVIKLLMFSMDKPARLSFSCSLDLLLISIKQI